MEQPPDDWDIILDETELNVGEISDRLDRAAILCQRDPLRRGNVVHLPPAGDAVIVGDLHGDRENLERILKWACLHRHRDRYLILQELIHGGPDDGKGGDQSFRLLEEAASLKCRYKSQVHLLLSNHDLGELMGATMTKAGRPVSEQFRKGVANIYDNRWLEVYEAYRRFLLALPIAARTAHGVFISHSTPKPGALAHFDYSIFNRPLTAKDFETGSSLYELLWGRHHDQRSADRFAEGVGARLFITGHESSIPGVKTPTSRHIVLTSDGPLGTVLLLALGAEAPHGVLTRQAKKIRSLKPPKRRRRRRT